MSTPPGDHPSPPRVSLSWLSAGWRLFNEDADLWMCVAFFNILIRFVTLLLLLSANKVFLQNPGVPFLSPVITALGQVPSGFLLTVVFRTVTDFTDYCACRLALAKARGEKIRFLQFFAVGNVALPLLGLALIVASIEAGVDHLAKFTPIHLTGIKRYLVSYIGLVPLAPISGLVILAPLVVSDRRTGPLDALISSFEMLRKQWISAAVFAFVCSLLVRLGVFACCIGAVIIGPVVSLSLAVGYLAFAQATAPPAQHGLDEPGTWPPPPTV